MADRGSSDRAEQADPGEKKRGVSPVGRGALALSLTLLLMQACASGDVATVVDLVAEKNANPFERDESGRTPLGVACEAGHLEVVRHLIEKEGVSPGLRGAGGTTPLHIAARGGHVEVAKYLINEKGVDPSIEDESGVTPLDCAQDGKMRRFLLNRDARLSGSSRPNIEPSTTTDSASSSRQTSTSSQSPSDEPNPAPNVLENALGVLPIGGGSSGSTGQVSTQHLPKPALRPTASQTAPDPEDMAALLFWTGVGNLSQVKRLVEVNHVDPQSSENEQGVSALHCASQFGHLDIVKYFVEERKCDVECRDQLGRAPIHYAARGGKLSVVKYLINVGRCDPMCRGQDGWTTLHSACKSDSLELVKYLVEEKKIDPSYKEKHDLIPLHIAAEIGTLDVVQYLVKEQQCDIDSIDGFGNNPLHHAAGGGKLDTVEYLINERGCDPECTNSLGWTPLHSASRTGKLDVVKYLKEEKNVNSTSRSHDGSTPLHGAATGGALDVVKYLLEEQQCDIDCRTNSGRTALHDAAMEGKLDVVQYLISERGCDPETVDREDGQTTLYYACISGSLDVVKYLIIDRKVQLHKDASATPLHIAIYSGHLPIVKFLVEECQYELGARKDGGLTPVQYARMLGHTEISSYLSSVVAKKESQLDPYARAAKPTGTVLGHGAYGKVIELTSAGEVVAGKVFRMYGTEDKQEIAKAMQREMHTMMQLSHPNIVQCKGVSYLPDQPLPVLLMERLMTSLHAYLLSPDNSDLPVERKVSFLLDTARGLDYLHSRTPAIIHRDLTAKNVLLHSKLRAKIADFGNSRITDLDPNAIPGTMTSLPGTLDYMPPEAQGGGVTYDPSLDVFSFGHLSLFTVVQTALRPLLPSTYTDSRGTLAARSEVERRMHFVEKAKQVLGSHPLLQLIQECLSNQPPGRPQTGDLVTRVQEMMTGGNVVMGDLITLSTSNGEIRIAQQSAPNYREIGTILLNDDNGARVDAIRESAFGNTVETVRVIYKEWIREKEEHTWKKLTQCLRAVQLIPLAAAIEQHFGLPSPSDQGQAREETTFQGPPAKKQTDHASASTGEGNPASAEDKPHEGGTSSSPAHQ